jgi:hypothetical protein
MDHPDVGRVDETIAGLERFQRVARDILDAYVDARLCDAPPGTPFGSLKYFEIAQPAGSALNYIAALKLVRDNIVGGNKK